MSALRVILLIGGAGFIGRALAARFVAEGYEVHVLSRHSLEALPLGVIVHQGGQENPAVVAPLLDRCCDVFHLAAATTPADTVWRPSLEVEASLLPALRFLECAQDFPHNRYFFVSTGGALYGDASFANEQTALAPVSYHGAGKLALEAFFGVLGQRYPGSVTILRPSNIYGPGQSLKHGFGVVRTLLERAKDGDTVTVYGDGSVVRDYLYIDDFVLACLKALTGPSGIYNCGAGQGTSLASLLELIERVTGRVLQIEYQPVRASDVKRIVLDIKLAEEQLNWVPSVSLEEGVLHTWESLL